MTSLASLAPWALLTLVGSVLLFMLALVVLVSWRRNTDYEVRVSLVPPKIIVRPVHGSDYVEPESVHSEDLTEVNQAGVVRVVERSKDLLGGPVPDRNAGDSVA